MAGISYQPPIGGVNPTPKKMPVQLAGAFVDSDLRNQVGDLLESIIGNVTEGIEISFTNGRYRFGAIDKGAGTGISIDRNLQTIVTESNGINQGLKIDAVSGLTIIGDIDQSHNGYNIEIDDGAQEMRLNGTGIITASASGASGLHLKLKINGVPYVIELQNP